MKALVGRGDGRPAVDLADVPEPTTGPDQILLDVAALAINRGELRLLSTRSSGWRPGQDVSGVVSREAADGSGPKVGTRVVAWPPQEGWAQRVAVPTSHVAVIHDDVTHAQASTLPIAGMTALRALRIGGDLNGKSVLVTGASGGVGRFAVELAAGAGAHVVAVSSTPDRAQGLAALGADRVTNEIDPEDGVFDLILESVGGSSLEAAIRSVAPGGTVVVFGNSSGFQSALNFPDFRGKPGAKIQAFFVYESGESPTFGEDLQLLADMVAEDRLHPQIGLEISWTQANEALRALADREVNGKAVLLVD